MTDLTQRTASIGWAIPSLVWSVGVLLALVLQAYVPTNADVSWLLFAAERMLAGSVLYVDILEVNPPASVLVYVPVVAVSQLIGISSDAVLDWYVVLFATLTVIVCRRILTVGRSGLDPVALATAVATALLLLPFGNFAQREHLAVIAILPTMAMTYVDRHGDSTALDDHRSAKIYAGLTTGIAVCLKPHFGLIVILPQLIYAIQLRNFRLLFNIQNHTTLLIFSVYAAVATLYFPHFYTYMLPIALHIYRPVVEPIGQVLGLPLLFFIATLGYVRIHRPVPLSGLFRTCVWAALAGGLVYLEQMKGWAYHFYPAAAFLVIGIVYQTMSSATNRARLVPPAAVIVLALIYSALPAFPRPTPFAEQIRANLSRPTVAAITDEVGLSFPFVTAIDGRWIAAGHSQWISGCIMRLVASGELRPDRAGWIQGELRAEVQRVSDEILESRPDILLVDLEGVDPDDQDSPSWYEWARSEPRLSEALDHYKEVDRSDRVALLVRHDRAAPWTDGALRP